MKNKATFKENELQANKIAIKILSIMVVVMTLVLILNIVGVFTVPMKIMIIAYAVNCICAIIPIILVVLLKYEYEWIKYVIIGSTIIGIFTVSMTLRYHVVGAFILPVLISTLYLSKKLNVITSIITTILVTIGETIGYTYNTVLDLDWTNYRDLIVFVLIPRALILIAMSIMLTMICIRISAILSELMGAKEQKEMLEKTAHITQKAKEISSGLVSSMDKLRMSADIVSETNNKVSEQTSNILNGSMENKNNIDVVNDKIVNINNNIENLNSKSGDITGLSEDVRYIVEKNQDRINKATNSMEKIYENVDDSKNIIAKLGEKSSEIANIINIITEIASQTNILSLNASIEAARAGEQGKGFAVVAEEIGTLASQTRESVQNIANIIEEVVLYTSKAENSMEMSVTLSKEGLGSIKEIKEASDNITSSNAEMSTKLINMDEITKVINDNSKEIVEYMNELKQTIDNNFVKLEQVFYVTKESMKVSDNLIGVVDKINEAAYELNKIVE